MRVLWIAAAVVLADQISKVVVKLSMFEGQTIPIVGRLFRLTFTENPGMAFGLTLGSKVFLTIFSVIATVLILLYLRHVRTAPVGYRTALAFILGGAFGNAIDRVAYGAIWGECPPSPPGSSRLLYGCVVDFLHLDVWSGPVAGRYVQLFPIGNIADVSIIVGVVLFLLTQGAFQRHVQAQEALATAPAAPLAPSADAPTADRTDV